MLSALALAKHLDQLGPPPFSCDDYVGAVETHQGGNNWTMMGNDQYGDCVIAMEGHLMMVRTANASSIIVPSTSDILGLYTAETGFNPSDPATDQGTNMSDDAEYMVTHGILGHKADAIASIDPGNQDHLKWCNQLFGGCAIGINVPQSMMDQFQNGQPLDDIGDRNYLGGHGIPIVHYDGTYFYVVTWGKRVPATPAFVKAYTEEAHALFFFDWVRAVGSAPNNLNLTQLASDLPQL